MKGWKFADGQTVNAQSVMFFLNMYKADPTVVLRLQQGVRHPRPGGERQRIGQHRDHQLLTSA